MRRSSRFRRTGTFADLEALRAQIQPGVRELMSIPGLGPKKAMVLYRELDVSSVPELVAAIEDEQRGGVKGSEARPRRTSCVPSPGQLLRLRRTRPRERRARRRRGAPRRALALKQVRRAADAGSCGGCGDDRGRRPPCRERRPSWTRSSVSVRHQRARAPRHEVIGVQPIAGLQVDNHVVPKDVWGAAISTSSRAPRRTTFGDPGAGGARRAEAERVRAVRRQDGIRAETERGCYERLGAVRRPDAPGRGSDGRSRPRSPASSRRCCGLKDLRGDLHTHTNLTDGLVPLGEMLSRRPGPLG